MGPSSPCLPGAPTGPGVPYSREMYLSSTHYGHITCWILNTVAQLTPSSLLFPPPSISLPLSSFHSLPLPTPLPPSSPLILPLPPPSISPLCVSLVPFIPAAPSVPVLLASQVDPLALVHPEGLLSPYRQALQGCPSTEWRARNEQVCLSA